MRLAPAEEAVRVAAASSTTVKIEGVTVKVEEEVALLSHCTRLAALFTELVFRLEGMLTKTIGSEKWLWKASEAWCSNVLCLRFVADARRAMGEAVEDEEEVHFTTPSHCMQGRGL
jgi:hypothetical protein